MRESKSKEGEDVSKYSLLPDKALKRADLPSHAMITSMMYSEEKVLQEDRGSLEVLISLLVPPYTSCYFWVDPEYTPLISIQN